MNESHIESVIPTKIEKTDIAPNVPDADGVEIILQRHGKYERSRESPRVGSLTEEGAEEIYAQGKEFFNKIFELLSEPERRCIDVLVIGSDTQYQDGGRRSIETANIIIEAFNGVSEELNLEKRQLLNASRDISGGGNARPTPKLREPQIFNNSPEFVEFLKEQYGDLDKEFWIAYEEDKEKIIREKMSAEGPDEIATRMKRVIEILARYSRFHHSKYPGRRLIIWAVTHYDTISPYVKREILKVGKDIPLGVDYGAGISIDLGKDGKGKTKISGQEYGVDLAV